MTVSSKTTLADILLHTLGEPRGFKSALLLNSLDWKKNRERVRHALAAVLPKLLVDMQEAASKEKRAAVHDLGECFAIVVLISATDKELFFQLSRAVEDFVDAGGLVENSLAVEEIVRHLVYGTIEPATWVSKQRSEDELERLKVRIRAEAREVAKVLEPLVGEELLVWANTQYRRHELRAFFEGIGSC